MPARLATDFIHSVIEANRTFYSQQIVERLENSISLKATENWEKENALPLPTQFLTLSSQISNSRGIGMKYRLISLSPINPINSPSSDLERLGMREIMESPKEPFTWTLQKGASRIFQAIYPDLAVTQSCVSCHNSHPQSSKRDFKVGDVMGGIVIDIPLKNYGNLSKEGDPLIPSEIVADYIHSVIESDRTVYSKHIVNRLQNKNIVHATENWLEENSLPLPIQFLSNAGFLIKKNKLGLDCRLISLWPINLHNEPANEFERIGLKSVAIQPFHPYIGKTHLGETQFFQAIFPDLAVTPACVDCHNAHPKSPKRDFKLNDIMGGIIISFPIP
ncbi:MAG: hypothetical protein NPINA01_06070 [Nitrospinaceae bacterium]|nr:MAG: hypothetical protein NPINA01_06070 [Nitrospinaceae bacterium]